MKIEIVYTCNEQLWSMENIAAENGYTKTDDCYWVQIFRNGNGDSIVTTREDGVLTSDPVERLAAILSPAEENEGDTLDENTAHCKRIADELDEYVNGNVRRCPDCGELHARDWGDVGDLFKCPSCGAVGDPDWWDVLSVWDFLTDVYNVEFRTNGRRVDDLRSVQIMVACGGPNIYLDTASGDVELYWWSDRARWPMSSAAVEALDDWAAEYWGCV